MSEWRANAPRRCGGEAGPEHRDLPRVTRGTGEPRGGYAPAPVRATASFWKAEKPPAPWTLLGSPGRPECFLHDPHLPLHLLRDLFNPQLIVLRQELQLLVNKPQPLLPFFPHLQAVDPERKRAGLRSRSPPDQAEERGDARKAAHAPAGAPAMSDGAQKHALPVPEHQPCALRSASWEEVVGDQGGCLGRGEGGRLEQILLINPGKKKLSLTSHRGNEIKKRYDSTQAGTWQKSPSLKCR